MPDIKHLLKINASAENVNNAIATISGLKHWWTPEITGDEKVSSAINFHFGPDYFKEMQVVKVVAGSIQWKCTQAVEEWVGTTIVFEIEEKQGECILHFAHADWADYSRMFSQCSFDWAMFLRSLKMYCETGKGQPFPNQGKINN